MCYHGASGEVEGAIIRRITSWNGNWTAGAIVEPLGDDILFLPAPDFGNGQQWFDSIRPRRMYST